MDSNIPETLDEAVQLLKDQVKQDEQQKIKDGELDAADGHYSIGRWMRNNWGLWSGDSRLFDWFVDHGIRHADDMSGIILDKFQADLRDEPFDLSARIEHYRDHWRKMGVDPDEIGIQRQG